MIASIHALAETIVLAQIAAIERLVSITQKCENDREARMAAAALLSLSPPKPEDLALPEAASLPRPPVPPEDANPLTLDEVARLEEILPKVHPRRFAKMHSADYWRAFLQAHKEGRSIVIASFSSPPKPASADTRLSLKT